MPIYYKYTNTFLNNTVMNRGQKMSGAIIQKWSGCHGE